MPNPPSSGRTILALSIALGAALLVIAFLLGRESARVPATAMKAELPSPLVLEPDVELAAGEADARPWPEWADLTEWEDVEYREAEASEAVAERIERRPDGTLLLSNRRTVQQKPRTANDSTTDHGEAAVVAYLQQMDLIRSDEGAGDPNAFAMNLIGATLRGSTSEFDQLIADTRRMEQEIQRVTPPPSCERYHQANLEALAEGRAILEGLKTAIARQDIGQLTAVAQQAETLQAKAEALKQMREQIYANARR